MLKPGLFIAPLYNSTLADSCDLRPFREGDRNREKAYLIKIEEEGTEHMIIQARYRSEQMMQSRY